MKFIVIQVIALILFGVGSLVLGLWVRRSPVKLIAEKASRCSHLLYWGFLVVPGMIGFFYPGLPHYDDILGLPHLPFRIGSALIGSVLLAVGLFFLGASNRSLMGTGKGAAAFLLTKHVVSDRVYELTRNPMSLGYYLGCVGVGLLAGSTTLTLGSLALVVPVHVFNLKYFEEVELEIRHGQAYRDYKRHVPFLLPRIPSRK